MKTRPPYLISALPVLMGLFAATTFAQDTIPVAQDTQAVSAPATPSSPFSTAKTVQARGLFSVSDSKGQYTPFFDVTITVEQPNRYRIDALPLTKTDTPKPASFYFSDGAKQYEYNSFRGRYNIKDAPKPDERWMSQLAFMARLDLILKPDAAPRPGVERTVTEETVDGRKMIVTTDNEPARKLKDGRTMIAYTKTWIDVATGFPIVAREGAIIDGTVHPNLQFEFKEWKLNETVPPQLFVWSKPEGSEEDHEDILPVGMPAPDFKAITPDGKTVRLSDFKGKIVVLDFWATWCGPCQQSMPHLEKIYQQVKNKGVVVLALCVWDEKPEYERWLKLKKKDYTFQTAFDPAGRGENNVASKLYKATGIPTQYVVDRTGKIAAGFVGYTDGDHRLEETLRKLQVTIAAPAAKKTANKPSTR